MPIAERWEDPGSFRIQLKAEETSAALLRTVREFGHIVITPQELVNPALFTDTGILDGARYAGVVLKTRRAGEQFHIEGQGMVWHLGDALGRGPIIFKDQDYSTGASITKIFASSTGDGILPPSVTVGTLTTSGVGTFTGLIQESSIVLDAVRTVAASLDLTWRVNPNGTIDVSRSTSDAVYKSSSTATDVVAVRKGWGTDPTYKGAEAVDTETVVDASEWASRSVIIDEGAGGLDAIPEFTNRSPASTYRDIHNTNLVRNVLSARPAATTGNSTGYMNTELTANDVHKEFTLKTPQWELSNSNIQVGDSMWIYDPPEFTDTGNQISFRGTFINPVKDRVTEGEWPLVEGMGVYYRPGTTSVTSTDYVDLTSIVRWEQ